MAKRRAQGADALTAIHSAVHPRAEVTIVRSFRAILLMHRLEFYQRALLVLMRGSFDQRQ